MEAEAVTHAIQWQASQRDARITHAIILTDSMNLLQKVESGMGCPDWHTPMHSLRLQRLLWIYCPGHAGVSGNERADRLASTADITSGLQLGRAEVLRGLRNFLSTDKPEHHSIDRLKERGVEKGSGRHSTLQGRKRSVFNQTNIGTVSRATLGRLLRDGAERVWAFPSATMPSWAETETETENANLCSLPWIQVANFILKRTIFCSTYHQQQLSRLPTTMSTLKHGYSNPGNGCCSLVATSILLFHPVAVYWHQSQRSHYKARRLARCIATGVTIFKSLVWLDLEKATGEKKGLIPDLPLSRQTPNHRANEVISPEFRTHSHVYGPTEEATGSVKSDRLAGLVVKASASRAEDPGFESRLRRDFSGSSHTSDLKIGTPVATLSGSWWYRISARTGWPGVNIMWLSEMESWICDFYLNVAARKIVWADPSLRYTSMLVGR